MEKMGLIGEEKFYNIFRNLSIDQREKTSVIIDNQPISWKVARMEIMDGSELGKKILKELVDLKIIILDNYE